MFCWKFLHSFFITSDSQRDTPPPLIVITPRSGRDGFLLFFYLKCWFEQLPTLQIKTWPTLEKKKSRNERGGIKAFFKWKMHDASLASAAHFNFFIVSPGCCNSAISPVVLDGLAWRLFHALAKLLRCSLTHTHTLCAPSIPPPGRHCCTGLHFGSQRIGATCLAFLSLKDSTSSSTKTPIVPSRPRSLGEREKRSGVAH